MTIRRDGNSPRFSIVILNWNSRGYLQQCLEALGKQSFRSFEVVCIDNGSTDDSREWLDSTDCFAIAGVPVKVYYNDINTGFAAGMNRGMRAAEGEWVIALNVDVFPAEDFLEQTERVIASYPEAAMIGPKVYRYDGGPTETVICTSVWPTAHMSVVTDVEEADEERYVFGPAGCCPIFARRALDDAQLEAFLTGAREVQYYDEVYFAYGEDVDLYFRLNLLGHRCIYAPAAKVWHVHSGTQDGIRWHTKSTATITRLAANAWFTWLKNCSGYIFWKYLPLIVCLPVLMSIRLLTLRPGAAWAPLAAYARIMRFLPRMLRIRRYIQDRRSIGNAYIKTLFR